MQRMPDEVTSASIKDQILSAEPHLCSRELPQASQEPLIFHSDVASAGIASNTEDLRESDLPGRVAVKLDVGSKDNDEVRFTGSHFSLRMSLRTLVSNE